MLIQWWATVFDISPALSQHWVNVSWFVDVARGCRCFRFSQLYTLGSVRGWSSCTIRPIISEDILHNSVHVLNIFFIWMTNAMKHSIYQLNAIIWSLRGSVAPVLKWGSALGMVLGSNPQCFWNGLFLTLFSHTEALKLCFQRGAALYYLKWLMYQKLCIWSEAKKVLNVTLIHLQL